MTRRPLWRHLKLTTGEGKTYLDRRGFQTRWFNLYLHHIDAPDPGRALHNHPWVFWSFVLRGGYREEVRKHPRGADGLYHAETRLRSWRRWTLHTMRLTDWHRIVKVEPDTWTLILTGRYKQKWGFLTPDGFVPHEQYRHAGLATDDNDPTTGTAS